MPLRCSHTPFSSFAASSHSPSPLPSSSPLLSTSLCSIHPMTLPHIPAPLKSFNLPKSHAATSAHHSNSSAPHTSALTPFPPRPPTAAYSHSLPSLLHISPSLSSPCGLPQLSLHPRTPFSTPLLLPSPFHTAPRPVCRPPNLLAAPLKHCLDLSPCFHTPPLPPNDVIWELIQWDSIRYGPVCMLRVLSQSSCEEDMNSYSSLELQH